MPRYTSRRPEPRAYDRPFRLRPLVKLDRTARAWLRHVEGMLCERLTITPSMLADHLIFGAVIGPANLGAELVKAEQWARDNREQFMGLIERLPLANPPPDMAG